MKLLFILSLALSLYGNVKTEMLQLYKTAQYQEVCNIGFDNFEANKRDEEYVSLYAFSCLKSDYIDRLAAPVSVLKFSESARANSTYFAVILMQKKLLYHALIDGYDLSSYRFPTTDYVLSIVFDLYTKLGKHEPREFYIFQNPKDEKLSYKLYRYNDGRVNKIVIEEYYDTIATKRHTYW